MPPVYSLEIASSLYYGCVKDTLIPALGWRCLTNMPFDVTVDFVLCAAAASALCVQKAGAMPSLPSREEVLRLLQQS